MLGRVKGTSKLLPTDRDKAASEAPTSQTKAPAPRKKPASKAKQPLKDKNGVTAPVSSAKPAKAKSAAVVRSSSSQSSTRPSPRKAAAMEKKSKVLAQENYALKAAVEGLEKERDFYFDKVRWSAFAVSRRPTSILTPLSLSRRSSAPSKSSWRSGRRRDGPSRTSLTCSTRRARPNRPWKWAARR